MEEAVSCKEPRVNRTSENALVNYSQHVFVWVTLIDLRIIYLRYKNPVSLQSVSTNDALSTRECFFSFLIPTRTYVFVDAWQV